MVTDTHPAQKANAWPESEKRDAFGLSFLLSIKQIPFRSTGPPTNGAGGGVASCL